MNINAGVPGNEAPPVAARVTIQVAKDKKIAHITAIPPENGGLPLQSEEIKKAIAAAGVFFGVSRECIDTLLCQDPPYGQLMLLAKAQLPQKGEDAKIEYHFDRSTDVRPKQMPDGSVDFKDLGLVHNVKAGDILCVKTPAAPGIPGTDVTGGEIPAPPGRDLALPVGQGTKIADDGLRLIAALDGQADICNKRVTIMNTFTVKDDVGIGTGNIDFVGNVNVGGNVASGYKIKAAGNVTVNGLLDGGSIESGGNVVIHNGFNGLNTGTIIAEGDLRCKYLQNCKADISGSVYTGAIVGSAVSSGESITVIGEKSQIYNSSLTARHAINCVNAGSSGISRPVSLEVGSDPGLTQKRVLNPKETAEAKKKLEQIEGLLAVFEARKARGPLDPDKEKEYETLLNLKELMQIRLTELLLESEDIERRSATSGYGNIVAAGVVKEGTNIVIGPERLVLKSDQTFVRFSRAEGRGIMAGPAR